MAVWQNLHVLVTGATGGIGVPLCEALVAEGAHVIVHGREQDHVDALADRLGAARVVSELASLYETARLELPHVDVLINNAGVGFGRDQTYREVSRDNYELRFAVNYLAAVVLTERAKPTRAIVNVASAGQRALDFADLQCTRGYDGIVAYRRSKLAMVMWTFDLAAAQPVPVVALHPGTFLDTGMVRESGITPLGTAAHGAEMVRIVAERALAGATGSYFDEQRPERADPQAYDPLARELLRTRTRELIAPFL